MFERDIRERAGPHVLALCGVTSEDSAAACRTKLVAGLSRLAESLPQDEKLAVLAALAIHPDARQRFLNDRVIWAAERIGRDQRTARRRVDDGLRTLAEMSGADDPVAERPRARADRLWQIQSFDALLRLDVPAPEVLERRTITFTRDAVSEIVAEMSLPPRSDVDQTIEAEILYGGQIVRAERRSASNFRFTIQLPRAFHAGAEHSYAMRFRLPNRQAMGPHYAFVPFHPCTSFVLRLRFSLSDVPTAVWRLEGVPPRMIDDRQPTGETLKPDSVGDLQLTFQEISQGLAYGAQWEPATQRISSG